MGIEGFYGFSLVRLDTEGQITPGGSNR
jgi:hypothetical protein